MARPSCLGRPPRLRSKVQRNTVRSESPWRRAKSRPGLYPGTPLGPVGRGVRSISLGPQRSHSSPKANGGTLDTQSAADVVAAQRGAPGWASREGTGTGPPGHGNNLSGSGDRRWWHLTVGNDDLSS
jgi:hypothetical protein